MKAMKNAYAISSLSRQMVKVCEQIDSLRFALISLLRLCDELAEFRSRPLPDENTVKSDEKFE